MQKLIFSITSLFSLSRSYLKIRIFVRYQGEAEDQPAGILKYVEDLRQGLNADTGRKDFFEITSNGFNGFLRLTLVLLFTFVIVSCATFQTSSSFKPSSINEVRFRDRAISQSDSEVRVTVAVPTSEEARELFGTELIKKEIQPVWVMVENHSDRRYHLISIGMDPNYFSPMETVYTVRGGLFGIYRDEMERHFRSMNFRNPILPYTAVSGFVYTNLDEGEKVVQVDLVATEQVKVFTFFVQIPGMRVDYRMLDFNSLYEPDDIRDVDEEKLRLALEELPCCTTNQTGDKFGDPMNLVVIGDFRDIAAAFARRGWLPAEETYSTAVWKTVKSFFFGSRYRYSPVSPLYFYGRSHDFARQKPRHDIHERNHLRLWYSPLQFQGMPVFFGQVSRDIGVRFTNKTWPPVTHKIDPDIDEARNALGEDLLYSQMLARVGYVKGVGAARPSNPRVNLTGDPYFTDGYRLVMILDRGPIAMDKIKSMDWENPKLF
jgi:LssY C-terminus